MTPQGFLVSSLAGANPFSFAANAHFCASATASHRCAALRIRNWPWLGRLLSPRGCFTGQIVAVISARPDTVLSHVSSCSSSLIQISFDRGKLTAHYRRRKTDLSYAESTFLNGGTRTVW